jgi:hypothetical protein
MGVDHIIPAAHEPTRYAHTLQKHEHRYFDHIPAVPAQIEESATLIAERLRGCRPEVAESFDRHAVNRFSGRCARSVRRKHVNAPTQSLEILGQMQNERRRTVSRRPREARGDDENPATLNHLLQLGHDGQDLD